MKFNLNENQFIDIINEAKSISDVVRKVAEYLSDVIADDLGNRQERRRVGMVDMFFMEGELEVDLSGFSPNLGNITLKYTIYRANDISELEKYARMANISLNSEYDDDTNTLTVVSYMNSDGNVVMDDVDESIYHELTHMFQYANGMEKRVSLEDMKYEIKKLRKKLLNAEEAFRINENMMKKNIDNRFLSLTLESITKYGWKYAEYGVERFYKF